MNAMANTSRASVDTSSSDTARRARRVVVVAAIIVVLALVSAFGWPGWAVRSAPEPAPVSTAIASAKPTIEATALPEGATALLQAMPDHVGSYVRVSADTTDVWSASKPLEEYALAYSTGDDATKVSVTVAQWSATEDADEEYLDLAKALKGKQLAAGNVKVAGEKTGSYVVVQDEDDEGAASALWRNDTVCILMTGPAAAVETLVRTFPL